ncbi:hypothetical protein HAX54_053065 [Datura stramonium]|uniref:Uncharacterized protein n=1 Tax=Datura stramonium TaxID=4076 RepID=A0ABS8WP39_DATST|nr:hypothetical protein [Datura stramonium]
MKTPCTAFESGSGCYSWTTTSHDRRGRRGTQERLLVRPAHDVRGRKATGRPWYAWALGRQHRETNRAKPNLRLPHSEMACGLGPIVESGDFLSTPMPAVADVGGTLMRLVRGRWRHAYAGLVRGRWESTPCLGRWRGRRGHAHARPSARTLEARYAGLVRKGQWRHAHAGRWRGRRGTRYLRPSARGVGGTLMPA